MGDGKLKKYVFIVNVKKRIQISKRKYELQKLTICISYVKYYQYIDLFSCFSHM